MTCEQAYLLEKSQTDLEEKIKKLKQRNAELEEKFKVEHRDHMWCRRNFIEELDRRHTISTNVIKNINEQLTECRALIREAYSLMSTYKDMTPVVMPQADIWLTKAKGVASEGGMKRVHKSYSIRTVACQKKSDLRFMWNCNFDWTKVTCKRCLKRWGK